MKRRFLPLILLLSVIFLRQHVIAQVTPATMQQIQSLLKEKNNRTPTQRKIDSRLLQAVKEGRGEKMTLGVSLAPANVNANASGVLNVDINADITPAFLSKIASLGGRVIYASPRYHTVRASLNLKAVETIAGYREVKFIQPAVQAMLVDAGINKPATSYADRIARVKAQLTAYLNTQHPLTGNVTSEGDATHRANDVRSAYGFLGQGIKIGVLSDSYNALGGESADVAAGDLPGPGNPDGDLTPVTVVQDYAGGADEGRAMLQVVHDLAPKATLFFASAFTGEAAFASNIMTLRNTYNCDIIIDDVFYYDEPAFQDGIIAQAVNLVTASGALYFSAAGNEGSLAKGTSGIFEGDFNDAGSLPFPGSTKSGTIHNFGTVGSPVNGDIILAQGNIYNLKWSDPMGASGNDYDLFVVSSTGTVKSASTNIQSGTQDPYEAVGAGTLVSGDRLVVFKAAGAATRALHLNTNRGTLTVATNGQTSGHSCAVNAYCVAATPAVGPYPNPFNSTNQAEYFSSDGPRRMFYKPDGTAITPGNVLFGTNGGTVLAKPDITAADGVHTTLPNGLNNFFGTSCAAPHAGAIAALLLSGNPSLTPAQVRTILTSTALDIEGSGYDNISGYGIVQAFQAATQIYTGACITPTGLSASSITNTSATLNWSAAAGALKSTLQYRAGSPNPWTVVTDITTRSYNITGLTPNTKYNFKVQSVCSGKTKSAYSTVASFKTNSYCSIAGTVGYEYINRVKWGSLDNTSGANGGYANYTDLSKSAAAGATQKINLAPGFYAGDPGAPYDEYWEVYIDYNQDKDFTDDGEKVGQAHGTTSQVINFIVPLTAKNGKTVMRIVMHYGSYLNNSCGNFSDGEAEDYTVKVTGGAFNAVAVESDMQASLNSLMISPNPVIGSSASVVLQAAKAGSVNLKIADLSGRILRSETISSVMAGKNTYPLRNINLLPGTYMVIAQQGNAIIARTQFVVDK